MSSIESLNPFNQLAPVRLVANSSQSGIYFNGALNNGIGAKFIYSAGVLTIDGSIVNFGDSILFTAQSDATQNGIYQCMIAGNINTMAILQRRGDFQCVEQMKGGQYISVQEGTTYGGTLWSIVNPIPQIIGQYSSVNANNITITPVVPASVPSVTPQDVQKNTFNYAVDTGVADAYVATFTPPNSSLTDGQVLWVQITNTNTTTTPTLAVDGLTAVVITYPDGSAVAASDLSAGIDYQFQYNATTPSFGVMNPDAIYGGGGVTAADIQNSAFVYGVDTGNAGAHKYQIILSPAITAYVDGMVVFLGQIGSNSNATSTLALNALSGVTIKYPDGSTLAVGEMEDSGYTYMLQYVQSSNYFALYNPYNLYRIYRYLYNGVMLTISDTGSANTYSGAYTTSYGASLASTQGMFAYLIVANTNTTASTFQLTQDASPLDIVKAGGGALTAGMMVAGYAAHLFFNGTAWQLLNPA